MRYDEDCHEKLCEKVFIKKLIERGRGLSLDGDIVSSKDEVK